MTPRAHRAIPNVVVVALATLVLMAGLIAAPASASVEPKRPHKHAKKHAAKRHVKKRVSRGVRVVQIANRLTGAPYRWGGSSPSGFDCSGLVQYVYSKVGISLPHHAASQFGYGRRVARSSLRAGDLVFFSGLGHVGIYAGGGKFIHAPRRGTTVRWSRMSSHGSFYGARRLVASSGRS
jgi:cell wall-associated NlpC family hydrolase